MDGGRLSLTRRKILGLSGTGLSAVGAMMLGWYRPETMPDIVIDWMVNRAEEPPTPRALWQPTVTRNHAGTLVSMYEDVQEEALALSEESDSDDPPFGLQSGWKADASEALEGGNYNEAARHVRYGIQFEGEALGELRAELGEARLESLAERSADILDRIETIWADIADYPVEKPERDLAWYVTIEIELQRGRSLAEWSGFEEVLAEGETAEITNSDPIGVGTLTRNILQAEIAVEDARRYRDRLSERQEGTRPYASHLRSEIDRLRGHLEGLPTKDEIRDTYVGEAKEYGPYEFAHARLGQWLFPTSVMPPWREPVDEEFLVLGALAMARQLADWRAHETVVERLDIDREDDGFDPADVLEAKRTGYDTFERLVGTDPSPFLRILTEEAIGSLRAVDIDRDWDDDWSPWNERTKAYLYALLGTARLEEYPPLYDRFVSG